MRIKNLLLIFCLLLVLPILGTSRDSISTVYKNGEFITYCQVSTKVSDSISNSVTNDFNYQMRYDLDKLFCWALKGMNLRKEKNELMVFYFKSTAYNKNTNVIRGVGDVIIPGIITFPDIKVDSKQTEKRFSNGTRNINIELLYSDGFLKNMVATFTVIPGKNKTELYTLESHLKFGWFFNIFITQNRYKNIMEWRLKQLLHNLREEAELREKNFRNSKTIKT